MYSVWTNHLQDEEEKKLFRNQVHGAKTVLERLATLIDQEKQTLEAAELSTKIYDVPNWDYRAAHGNGFKAALRFINKLINLDQKEH